MDKPEQIRFTLEEYAYPGLDPHDAASLRAWRMACVASDVTRHGALMSRMVHVGVDLLRVGVLDAAFDPTLERMQAAVFSATASQPGIGRSYREGEILVDGPAGKRRAVVALEFSFRTGRWWAAHRSVGTNRDGVGVFHGQWVEREGQGIERLDDTLRGWVDTSDVALTAVPREEWVEYLEDGAARAPR
jgi:hypothetical protein